MADHRSNINVMLNLTDAFQFQASADTAPSDGPAAESPPSDSVPPSPRFCKAQPVVPAASLKLAAPDAAGTVARQPPVQAPIDLPAPPPEFIPFRVLDGTAQFNGDCEACRPYCGALCCKGYTLVHLSEAEAKSGRYAYTQVVDDCQCANCTLMRELNLKYNLLKKEDGSCYYLDEHNYCSIHKDRPQACRMYTCKHSTFRIRP